jgi:short-subunit dehydrogenase
MIKVLLIGASSGIGADMARVFHAKGYKLCLTARRTDKLNALRQELGENILVRHMDTFHHEQTRTQFDEIIQTMQGIDIVIYNAGIGDSSKKWDIEYQSIEVNAVGFANTANYFFDFFKQNKQPGQIVGISSIAAIRGSRMAIAYSATKAFMSHYLQGQRNESVKKGLGITLTDIRPGFIDTPMTEGQKGMFWVARSHPAAQQIVHAIEKRKSVAYITKRWQWIAWLFPLLPDFIWNRR